MRTPIAVLCLLSVATATHAQVARDAGPGWSGTPLEWSDLRAFHADIDARVAANVELGDAREQVARLLSANRDFRTLDRGEEAQLLAAHNRIVDVLALGSDNRLQCEKVAPLGSKRAQLECRFAGDDDGRERLRRLGANPRQTG